jgi:hypothetical protein
MNPLDLLAGNLLSPVVLAFALGALAVLLRSDLRFPEEVYSALSIFLLLAIGLKGGEALAKAPLAKVAWPALATVGVGVLTPAWVYLAVRRLGRFSVVDAAALAAHYGSVSAVTFAAALAFVESRRIETEGFLPALVAVLEVPAIIVALVIARMAQPVADVGSPDEPKPRPRGWGPVLHEVLAGRSVLLLLGGLAMGAVSTPTNLERVRPFFGGLFHGVLVLFLLDMGMVAAKRLREVRKAGLFLVAFAVVAPLINGAVGVLAGKAAGLGLGGMFVLGVMSGSASYIAAPAAVRIALPQANPGYYLTAAVGITFPFNLVVGIPAIYAMATVLA